MTDGCVTSWPVASSRHVTLSRCSTPSSPTIGRPAMERDVGRLLDAADEYRDILAAKSGPRMSMWTWFVVRARNVAACPAEFRHRRRSRPRRCTAALPRTSPRSRSRPPRTEPARARRAFGTRRRSRRRRLASERIAPLELDAHRDLVAMKPQPPRATSSFAPNFSACASARAPRARPERRSGSPGSSRSSSRRSLPPGAPDLHDQSVEPSDAP